MPYIVVTLTPPEWEGETLAITSRQAAATLEDAIMAVAEKLTWYGSAEPKMAAMSTIHIGGGSIDLPDGTKIEVEPADWEILCRFAFSDAEIINAYNRKQS